MQLFEALEALAEHHPELTAELLSLNQNLIGALRVYLRSLTDAEHAWGQSPDLGDDEQVERDRVHELRDRSLRLLLKWSAAAKRSKSADVGVQVVVLDLPSDASHSPASVEQPPEAACIHASELAQTEVLLLCGGDGSAPATADGAVGMLRAHVAPLPASISWISPRLSIRRSLESRHMMVNRHPIFADSRKAEMYQRVLSVSSHMPSASIVMSKWRVEFGASSEKLCFPPRAPRGTQVLDSADYTFPSQTSGQFDWHVQFSPGIEMRTIVINLFGVSQFRARVALLRPHISA